MERLGNRPRHVRSAAGEIRRVAGHQQDRHVGADRGDVRREREPVHRARHHHVRKHKIESISRRDQAGGVIAARRRRDAMARTDKDGACEREDLGGVVHHEDTKRSRRRIGRRGTCRRVAHRSSRGPSRGSEGQEDPHARAAPGRALELYVAGGLAREAEHLRQAKPRSLAVRLGGEERFEDARQISRRDPGARVLDRDRDETARARLQVRGERLGIQHLLGDGDGKLAALWHRVASIEGRG